MHFALFRILEIADVVVAFFESVSQAKLLLARFIEVIIRDVIVDVETVLPANVLCYSTDVRDC